MEFHFNIEKTIGKVVGDGIVFLDGAASKDYSQKDFENICLLLDQVGTLSATSQGLKSVITTGMKFFGTDQHIYIKCEGNVFIGFIKVGVKHLFIYNDIGQIKEMSPLCVLDFYTYEGCQRKGYGKEIYTAMINYENVEPRKLGYDRPSFKFLNFLKKYYNLEDYVPQNNNYVVFNDYFIDKEEKKPQQNYQQSYQQQPSNYYNNNQKSYYGNVDSKAYTYNQTYNIQYENEPKQEANQINDYHYLEKFKMPSSSYQYSRSNAEYGAFLNSYQK